MGQRTPMKPPATPAVAARTEPGSEPRFPGRVYPAALAQAEADLIAARRRALAGHSPGSAPEAPRRADNGLPADAVGFALSGGGIRSATFCLGVFQALARKQLLGQIDFLSTVSGGGYFGSFYGAWLNRGRGAPAAARSLTARLMFWRKFAPAEKTGADHFAAVQSQLAQPGSGPVEWLRQNGRYLTPNGLRDATLAVAGVIRNWCALHFVLTALLLAALMTAIYVGAWLPAIPTANRDFCGIPATWGLCWSPLFWIALAPALVGLLSGVAYWWPWLEADDRNFLNRVLAACLTALVIVLGLAALDSLGCTLWTNRSGIKNAFCRWSWELGGTGAVALLLVRRLVTWIRQLATRDDDFSLPLDWALRIGAGLLALVWLAALDVGAHALAERMPWSYPALFALVLLGAWHFGFVNLSSQAGFYGSRLTRAYVGASNPRRTGKFSVTELIPGDVVAYGDYDPSDLGGPLHLINVTVNETIDGRTQTEQEDRQGLNLALGPAGLSIAVRHHALWCDWQGRRRGGVQPIVPPAESAGRTGFHVLAPAPAQPAVHPVEQLHLGQWIGVSGAAFTTGLGARTNPALSFLCGFFNIRLGWWWDSGVSPFARESGFLAKLGGALARPFVTVLPVQAHLVDEFRARFFGTARRRWYLSDGGHFENTAAYELIRRRVPFIVICDDGCDPQRQIEDFGNLVRKARLDFDAEIEAYRKEEIPAGLARIIGSRDDLSADPKTPSLPGKPALLARVRYVDGRSPDSILLLVKPTVTGREPADVLNYHVQNTAFPQETTLDQFFDEAQWESYRRLGEFLADEIFGSHPPSQPLAERFRPRSLDGEPLPL